MSRALLLKRASPLAYPGGSPGFDPAHPAAGGTYLSAIPAGGNFVNLLNGKPGTATGGGFPNYAIYGPLGPSGNWTGNQGIAFQPPPGVSCAEFTVAAILYVNGSMLSSTVQAGIGNTDSNGWMWEHGRFGSSMYIYNIKSGTWQQSPTGLVPSVGYYLFIVSGNATTLNFLSVDLASGAIRQATQAISGVANTNTNAGSSCWIGTAIITSLSWVGPMAAQMQSSKFTSLQTMRQWAQDPWAFWYPRTFDLTQFLKAPAGGGAGTLATTEAADVAAFAGNTVVSGSLATTEAADVAVFTGNTVVNGSLTTTEATDTAALTGSVSVVGTLATTEATDTAALTGTVSVVGTLATTETTDAATFSGNVDISGTLAATGTADVAAFTGTVTSGVATGTLAIIETPDSASFTGTAVGGAEPQYTGSFSGWEGKRTKRERVAAAQEERARKDRKVEFRKAIEDTVRPPKPEVEPKRASKAPAAATVPLPKTDTTAVEIAELELTASKARVVSAELNAKSNLAEKQHKTAVRAEAARMEAVRVQRVEDERRRRDYDDALAILLLTSA